MKVFLSSTYEDLKEYRASVEDVIRAVKHRIEGFQKANGGKLDCEQNRVALANLNNALKSLEERSRNRKTREVEGTYQP